MNDGLIPRRTALSAGALAVIGLLSACASEDDQPSSSDAAAGDDGPRVLIVGAGVAGMTAAHLLRQRGVRAVVLEAGPTHGGRIKHDLEFTDFPIPLGAEWIHVEPAILDTIVNDASVNVDIGTTPYAARDELAYFEDGATDLIPLTGWDDDTKFVGSSWLDFFDRYVVPGIAGQITYDTQVTAIDHTGDAIEVMDSTGAVRSADAVVVTVPIAVLRRDDIEFRPPLSAERRQTLAEAKLWTGLKAFIEFDTKFYPAVTATADSETPDGQRLYYDAAYGQDSNAHIVGLFSVGRQAERYQAALADGALLETMLAELDEVFDGAASPAYRRHIVQNWADEPFIGQAYLADDADTATSRTLAESIDGRIFFAGDGYTAFDDWSAVHTAARSARDAIDELLS